MSTASKGKSREREIASIMRDAGWVVERVPGSGNRMGAKSDDLIFTHEQVFPWKHRIEVRGEDESGATIERRIKKGDLDKSDVFTAECKSREDAKGFKTLYKKHFEKTGMERSFMICWKDSFFSAPAGPLFQSRVDVEQAVANQTESPDDIGMDLPKGVKDQVTGEKNKSAPDFLFLKGVSRKWPMSWLAVWTTQEVINGGE